MRICISGTGCQGKSTLIDAFLERWPSYTTPKKTYRDLIVKEKYKHIMYKLSYRLVLYHILHGHPYHVLSSHQAYC